MTDQEILKVPRYIEGQQWGHVTLNEQKNAAAQGPQLTAESKTVTDPSTLTPQESNAWVIAAAAVGVWAGKGGQVAMRYNADWIYRNLSDGEIFTVLDEGNGSPARGKVWYNNAGSYIAVYTTP